MGARRDAGDATGEVMATACPRCGAPAVERDKCGQCGVVASVYIAALEKMRRAPAPPPPPSSAPRASAPPAATPPAARAQTAEAARPAPNGSGAPATAVMTPAPATTGTTSAAAMAGVPRRLGFPGVGGTLFGIYVVNILATIAPFGAYRFWGKVRIRRFMLSQTSFEGDRFAYHGTGKELLLGFFKALLFVGLPITALSAMARLSGDKTIYVTTQAFTSLLVFIFIPIAMVGARRYRLSRTSWRGIRFSFRGKAWVFVKIFIVALLLSALTLTLYYPFFQTRQQEFMVSNSCFGRRQLRFDGRGRDLLGAYVVALLLLVPPPAGRRRSAWLRAGSRSPSQTARVSGGPSGRSARPKASIAASRSASSAVRRSQRSSWSTTAPSSRRCMRPLPASGTAFTTRGGDGLASFSRSARRPPPWRSARFSTCGAFQPPPASRPPGCRCPGKSASARRPWTTSPPH